jgi:hypothetical protein
LKNTGIWTPRYESNNPNCIAFPATENITLRVIGPGHIPKENIADALIALTLYNSDLYLAEKHECQNISPFYSVGDLLNIKQTRHLNGNANSDKLWALLELNGVPDLSQVDLSQGSNLRDLLNVSTYKNAKDFYEWFHENKKLSEKEILREYLSLLQCVPWIQSLPSKALRFSITSSLGLIPGLGQAISIFDSFIVDRLFRGRSVKFLLMTSRMSQGI